jgi:hypothetical protein
MATYSMKEKGAGLQKTITRFAYEPKRSAGIPGIQSFVSAKR